MRINSKNVNCAYVIKLRQADSSIKQVYIKIIYNEIQTDLQLND